MTEPTSVRAIFELASAHAAARVLHVVAELGVADHIDEMARTSADIAAAAGLNPDALDRVLGLLATYGLFRRDGSGGWLHTELSRRLRSDDPRSLRSFVRMSGSGFCWGSVTELEHSLRTGRSGITRLHAGGPWAYLAAHPEQADIFQQAMTDKSHGDIAIALSAYDFSRHRRIADVGGGSGHLVKALLEKYPDTSGVLFDLPQVTANVAPTSRLDVVGGDFFVDPFPVCDAYVLMNIVHDWDDPEAAAILSAAAEAGRSRAATVLVIEAIMPEGGEDRWPRMLDVLMLAVTGGRERTVAEYETLLTRAGLTLVQVHTTTTPLVVIEAEAK
ncbi:MAG TPA: methyltransferase [Actinomycetales bacterium]|nr:methyltransferase [Actinomycetales bacterium]